MKGIKIADHLAGLMSKKKSKKPDVEGSPAEEASEPKAEAMQEGDEMSLEHHIAKVEHHLSKLKSILPNK